MFIFCFSFFSTLLQLFFLLLFLRTPENPLKISAAGIINYISKESRNRLAVGRAETFPESPTRPSYKHNTYFIQNSKHPSPSRRKSCRATEYCATRTITVCTTKAQWAEKKQFFISLLAPASNEGGGGGGSRYSKMKNWHNWRYSSAFSGWFFFFSKFESIF